MRSETGLPRRNYRSATASDRVADALETEARDMRNRANMIQAIEQENMSSLNFESDGEKPDDSAFRLLGIPVPEWYINPDIKATLIERATTVPGSEEGGDEDDHERMTDPSGR